MKPGVGMKVNTKEILTQLGLALWWIAAVLPAQGGEPVRSQHQVLFISSYHPSYPTVPEQIRGLHEVFDPLGIHFDIEFMDAKRFDSVISEQVFLEVLTPKLAALPPYDLAIVADDNAFLFATHHRDSLLGGIPIVFLGVNDTETALRVAQETGITGVLEQPSYRDTVALFQRLQGPDARLTVITDASHTGQVNAAAFAAEMEQLGFRNYRLLSMLQLSSDEVMDQVAELRKPGALLVISANRDKDNQPLRVETFLADLRAQARVPVFYLWTHGIGKGPLGGKMVSHQHQARLAAQQAVRILEGTPAADLPVIGDDSNEWWFDHAEMERFKYTLEDMPADSQFVNQPDSLYERYRAYISALLVLAGALFVVVVILLQRMHTRRLYERKLMDVNLQLESTVQARTRDLQESREEAEHLLRMRNTILDNSLVGIVLVRDRKVEWINQYTETLFGYRIEELIGRPLDFVYARREDFDKLGEESPPVLQRGESYQGEFEFRRKDGSGLWGIVSGKALNPADLSEGVLFIVTDISARKQAEDLLLNVNARLEALATTDHLTGICNRRRIHQLIGEEIRRAARYNQPFSLILLDIDHFKALNDSHGHDAGDAVLKAMAALLQNSLRSVDAVARWGGEEFLVLCPETEEKDAMRLAELMRSRIAAHDFQWPVSVTASFGVAGFQQGESLDALVKKADLALYQAKQQRNCVHLFTP